MNAASQSTPSAEDIKLAFPHPTFDKTQGEPNCESIYKLETQAIRNAATAEIALPPPHGNLAGIIEQAQVHSMRTGAPFPRPAHPGNAPVFPPGANVANRQQIQQLNNTELRNYHAVQTTDDSRTSTNNRTTEQTTKGSKLRKTEIDQRLIT